MKCSVTQCCGSLRVSHTYTVGNRKFQRATCTECGGVHRLNIEATIVSARGEGAKAYAARAKEETQCGRPSVSLP
jgi:hypothetical protein